MTDLNGKTALITGSTSGIGLAIAQAMTSAGANVVLNGFGDEDAIEATRAELAKSHGVTVTYDGADMTKPDQIAAMIAKAEADFGALDILVNNAGIQHVAPVEEFPLEKWDAIIAINMNSAFHTSRAALPGMKARGFGRIIKLASAHGADRLALQGGLCHSQAWRGRYDQDNRAGDRAERYHLQRDLSGLCENAFGRGADPGHRQGARHHRRGGGARRHASRAAHQEIRGPRRVGRICGFPRLTGGCVDHRGGAAHGRRLDGAMTAPILYDYWRSSASYRVRIALNLLDEAYEARPVNLLTAAHHRADYLELNPQGILPTWSSTVRP